MVRWLAGVAAFLVAGSVVAVLPTAAGPSTLTLFPTRGCRWDKIPTVTIAGSETDPRVPLVHDAIAFWNRLLEDIGTPFRIGAAAVTQQTVANDYLIGVSEGIVGGGSQPNFPEEIKQMSGDLIVALSSADLVSFSTCPWPGQRVLVGIRYHRLPPLTLPNVPRNVIAHELGHAIGLGHNNDPTKLMCGRPAPCRPAAFASPADRYFPVADEEKAYLLRLYPRNWQPSR
jgi:hypothetical protein